MASTTENTFNPRLFKNQDFIVFHFAAGSSATKDFAACQARNPAEFPPATSSINGEAFPDRDPGETPADRQLKYSRFPRKQPTPTRPCLPTVQARRDGGCPRSPPDPCVASGEKCTPRPSPDRSDDHAAIVQRRIGKKIWSRFVRQRASSMALPQRCPSPISHSTAISAHPSRGKIGADLTSASTTARSLTRKNEKMGWEPSSASAR